MNKKHRLIIYPTDISLLTGRSVKHCRKIMVEIRQKKGKEEDQPVTVFDLAEYLGVDEELVWERIQ